jgi:hypothetical protein
LKYKATSRGSKSPNDAENDLKNADNLERFKIEISLEILKNLLSTDQGGLDLDPGFLKKKRKKRRKP